jgi:chromosome segregation ATPase
MAIFHHSIKIISRGKGNKSAVAAAAYRAGEKIQSDYDGRINDYTRKGGIAHTEILLPKNAPPEYADRTVLWNAVEKIEKAKNAQLARKIELALPVELTMDRNIKLVREYVKRCFVKHGMCADICIHDKNDGNPHAHIMLTMRPFNEDGSWGAKQKKEYILNDNGEKIYDKNKRQYKCNSIPATDWNEHSKAEEWREMWAKFVNMFLKSRPLRSSIRVDHRSYERQGIEQIPTVHLGVAAHQMEKRGIKTERGNLNREIGVTNQKLRQLKARINKLQNWLNEETAKTEPPTLHDVIFNMLSPNKQLNEDDTYAKIRNLKAAAKTLFFLQENNITDISELDDKIKAMSAQNKKMQDKLKPIERRLATLDEHIKHTENYKAYKDIYKEYESIDNQNTRGLYQRDNYSAILRYEAATKYMNTNFHDKKYYLKKWITERDELNAEKADIDKIYLPLKEETANIERIRKSVYDIMNPETHDTPTAEVKNPQRKKSYGMEI